MKLVCRIWTITILLWFSSALAAPQPRSGTLKDPTEAPLPGRTDTSIGPDGEHIAHYGDDWMPQHMQHVQQSIQANPDNSKAYPYRSDAQENRVGRLKNVPGGMIDPVTKEPLVRDEKTLASQNNPHQDRDSTFQRLPHYESGGKFSIPEDRRKVGLVQAAADRGKIYKYSGDKMPDGSLKTEGALVSRIHSKIEKEMIANPQAKENPSIRLKANPGWLSLDKGQQRAHEAPAKLGSAAGATEYNKLLPGYRKKEAKFPANRYQFDFPPLDPKIIGALAVKHNDPYTPPGNGADNFRPTDDPTKSKGRAKKSISGSKQPERQAQQQNSQILPRPSLEKPQYKPANCDANGENCKTTTPSFAPPTEKDSLTRLPPRPQSRESYLKNGLQRLQQEQPKDIYKGREGKSAEAPAGNKDSASRQPSKADVDKWKKEAAAEKLPAKNTVPKVDAPAVTSKVVPKKATKIKRELLLRLIRRRSQVELLQRRSELLSALSDFYGLYD